MRGKFKVMNPYLQIVVSTLLFQVATILFTGMFLLRHFPFIHIMNVGISIFIVILLITVKWKWVPIISILYGLLFSVLTVPSFLISMFQNIDPEYNAMLEASNPFIGISLLSSLYVVTILIASVAGLIFNIRNNSNHLEPKPWLIKLKYAFYGIVGMGILISFYLQLHWVTGVNANTLEVLPTIVMNPDSVEPASLELRAGQPIAIQVRNESENECHILSFPELEASVHMEQGRTGLLFINPKPGTYTYECKSHHDYFNSNIKGILTVHE
ncbi:cupredoxin domain-containing protein [Ornithinibacillus californiensis]|uniref:cupredoxin domain-containing protein n=1 Tax=Ornithinibacillus californiensis TaxID=161536 RepID=UPI00064DBE87|nr:cupredoxin domain-containing protein [Ornithinibacillus californiensis]